jgi:glycosidase
MIKEFLFIAPEKEVETVHIGVFPSRGRYFRRAMTHRGKGVFTVEVDVPEGEVFIHYFLNGDFSKPISNNLEDQVSRSDHLKRCSVYIGTEPFCALEFQPQSPYVSHVVGGRTILRAISHHSWVQAVQWESAGGESLPFQIAFCHKNKKYWTLELPRRLRSSSFYFRLEGMEEDIALHQENPLTLPMAKSSGAIASASHSIGYQIFPDRFHKSTSQTQQSYFHQWGDRPGHFSYFGGDLKGIIQKISYIKELGADFLYLNPIFAAKTSHRYDTIDYFRVDPLLGSSADFLKLVESAHRMGLRVILDLALNHCSVDFFAFKDVLHRQDSSEYIDWFNIHSFPVKISDPPCYDAWSGYKDMPEFNLDNPTVQNYLIKAVVFWLEEFGVNGFRLDACSHLPLEFTHRLMRAIENANPRALVIGELWHKNTSVLIEETGIHGITNYSFYWEVVVPMIEKQGFPVDRLADAIIASVYRLPLGQGSVSWNFLSNHDLPRLISVLPDPKLYRLAIALLYALPGSPVVYYGEELAMRGQNDPDNRRCMDWQRIQDQAPLLEYFKRLNKLRRLKRRLFESGGFSIRHEDKEKRELSIRYTADGEEMAFLFNFTTNEAKIYIDGQPYDI